MKELQSKLWGEAVMHCTEIENIKQSRSYPAPALKAFDVLIDHEMNRAMSRISLRRQFGEISYIKWPRRSKEG
jgi:hypothetical protein